MTISQALALARESLTNSGVPDPEVDGALIVSHVTGKQRLTLRLFGAETLSVEQERRFRSLLLSRAAREPLQYLLGSQGFYGLELTVDERVLIPRPETETLCEMGIAHLKTLHAPTALDLCTGSGAIAIALKHECPHARVTAADLSADALALAQLNAAQNGADIRFVQGDLFAPVAGERFDLILSNPPYIPTADCATLQKEVLREPRMALDGGADGLTFYRRIAKEAPAHLTECGRLCVEVGDGQAQAVAALFSETLGKAEIARDLYGKERIVMAGGTVHV